MAELGETADPRALVPGDPEAARATARAMVAYAGNLHEAGDGLTRISTPEGWTGEAADAFRRRFALQPPLWQDGGDAFTAASRALDIYAETVDWAQRQAADAVRVFGEAQAVSQQQAASVPVTAGAPPVDAGDAGRARAHELLDRARVQLAAAGDDAARTLDEAASVAANSRTFWDDVGDVLGDIGDAAVDVGRDVVNGAASIGNAALHHPAVVGAMLGGAGLIALGAAGEVGGVALDATGVAAPAGISLNVASAGLIATGAGLAGAGAISVAMNARGDDRVEPAGSGGNPPPLRPAAHRPEVEDPDLQNIVRDLYRGADNPRRAGDGTTADALRTERATGRRVGNREHFRKASQYVRALKRWLRRNPDASLADRGIAQNELNNLLEALGRTS